MLNRAEMIQYWGGGAMLLLLLLSGCALQPESSPSAQGNGQQIAAQLQLGVAYLEQKRLNLARQHLLRVVDSAVPASNSWREAHYAMALVEMRDGTEKQAEYHFQQALRGEARYPEVENGYGVLLCQQGRVAEAMDHFQRAISTPHYATPEMAKKNRQMCGDIKSR